MSSSASNRTRSHQTRQQVYDYVHRCITQGRPPSTRDVQRQFGFSAVQSARQHLEALVAEGRLTKTAGQARGYGLPVGAGASLRLVPLLGRVQAGNLNEAVEDHDGYLPVGDLDDGADYFALTVRGESMSGAAILPGDTVVVRCQETARDGDIVVALVGDEATVKRLRLHDGRITLQPENPAFQPIVIDKDAEVKILGRVCEVRRSC